MLVVLRKSEASSAICGTPAPAAYVQCPLVSGSRRRGRDGHVTSQVRPSRGCLLPGLYFNQARG